MKIIAFTLFIAFNLCLFQPVNAQQIDTISSLYKKLDAFLVQANKDGKFNGSVLVARNGSIILQKGYGWKNHSSHTLNNANTIFPIGSLTKPFTAMVILKLQEEGKISVNDKLSKYFPQQRDADKITIANLLNHTSGIYDFSRDIPEDDSVLLSHPVPRQTVLNAFINKPLAFKPGTKYAYCSSSYFILGLIIENLTGMPYEQVVRRLIFKPLGMDHSGFDFINLKSEDKATGYKILQDDRNELAVKWDSSFTYATGGIYSTTGDLYKWAKAIGKREILSQASWDAAFTPNMENYGYGWWIDSHYNGKYIYHPGGMIGFASSFKYYPDDDVAIIIQNNFGYYGQTLLPVSDALSAIIFNQPNSLLTSRTTVNVDDAILNKYTGTYTLNGKDKVYITLKDHQLYAESSSKKGIPKLPIFAEAESRFFLKDFDTVLNFIKNGNGEVVKLTSEENGKRIDYKKIK